MKSLCLEHFQHYLRCFSLLCVDGGITWSSVKHLHTKALVPSVRVLVISGVGENYLFCS